VAATIKEKKKKKKEKNGAKRGKNYNSGIRE